MRKQIVRGAVACAAGIIIFIAGCDRQSVGVESADAASPVLAGDPCKLLTTAEIAAFVPGAKGGMRDRSREEYGISACTWSTPRGRFAVQTWKSDPNSVENEIRGLSQGFIDPLMPGAKNNVRFETIPGVGDKTMIVIEQADAQRGILSDASMLISQRGDRMIVLQSDDLVRANRTKALSAFRELALAAMKRL